MYKRQVLAFATLVARIGTSTARLAAGRPIAPLFAAARAVAAFAGNTKAAFAARALAARTLIATAFMARKR